METSDGASTTVKSNSTASPEWDVAETWTKFVFPFWFDAEQVDSLPTWIPSEGWVERALETHELENMLPYVKQYLELPANHRRFEVEDHGLGGHTVFSFRDDQSLLFEISEIVLHLFFNGVGCLSLEIRPHGPTTIQYVQSINARLASMINGSPFHIAESHITTDDSIRIVRLFGTEEFMTIHQLIDALLNSFAETSDFWSVTPMVDRFLPVYGALLLKPLENTSIELMDERFFEFAQHHLTILRKTFTPNNISSFSEIHLEDSTHHYMPYHNVIHSQSLDGGYILAYDNGLPHFSKSPAPAMESFRTSYFFMMLIPFHQRLSILRYAMAAALAALSRERGAELRQLREEIYDFTARCYFSQASVSEERNHIYDRWQQEFHVVRMYNDLKEEVHDIDNYLADLDRQRESVLRDRGLRRDSRNMQLFALITLVFLPVSVVLYGIPAIQILGHWINFHTSPWRSFVILLGMATFVTCLLAVMFRFVRHAREVPGPP